MKVAFLHPVCNAARIDRGNQGFLMANDAVELGHFADHVLAPAQTLGVHDLQSDHGALAKALSR
ncbi:MULTISPECIES: hypothetical protein [Paraburkholderia]|uniref:Uncharacterized protein n=1 Tax=Paraburkholderia youngii TaxID=2782701 RepID=A0ABX2NZ21_9BURK|nr:hypothetical protein [Paraburkholderia youngii]NVI09105.1 hypothetical protein [Paraburkholderia youngii]